MRPYEFRLAIGFQETNLVGNVYFANHILWQGKCREMFLRDHAPDILDELKCGLRLVTTQVSCEYYHELLAFDEVLVRMYVATITQSRVGMKFEYFRLGASGEEELVARGEQQIACLAERDGQTSAVPVPENLRKALSLFQFDGSFSRPSQAT